MAAVFGNVRQAGLAALFYRSVGDVPALNGHCACIRLPQTGQRFNQLGLPVSGNAGNADNFSLADIERNFPDQPAPGLILHFEVLHIEHRFSDL